MSVADSSVFAFFLFSPDHAVQSEDAVFGRVAEKPLVLTAELGHALVPHGVRGFRDGTPVEKKPPGLLKPQPFLVLQGAQRRHFLEVTVECGRRNVAE